MYHKYNTQNTSYPLTKSADFEKSFILNDLYISFPLTGFKSRYGGTTNDFSLHNKSQKNLSKKHQSSPSTYTDDFQLTYDAFLAILVKKQNTVFSSNRRFSIEDNKIYKNSVYSSRDSKNLSILFRDTCAPDQKYFTLMQDLISNNQYQESTNKITYSLMISYENFWFCEASQIKYKGQMSNQKRYNILKIIRNDQYPNTTNIKPKWAMLSGDCLTHEFAYNQFLKINKCRDVDSNTPNVNSSSSLNPIMLPWIQFQNIAGTGDAVLALLWHFKWSQVAILSDYSTIHDSNMATYVETYLINNAVSVNSKHKFFSIMTKPSTNNNSISNSKSLQDILEEYPAFIRCVIIIGDIFQSSIQDETIDVLSKFVENRKIVDSQGTSNKVSILVLETEFSFKINSFNIDFSEFSNDSDSNAGSLNNPEKTNNIPKVHFFNSLFILTYIPFFGITQEEFNAWFLDQIDRESLYFEQSNTVSALKLTRIPSFLFSAIDYINFQSLDAPKKQAAINRLITIKQNHTINSKLNSTLDNKTDILINTIYEIKSDLIGYSRFSSEGLILASFIVMHYIEKLSSFRTVLSIQQDFRNNSNINNERRFKVLSNNETQFIESLFFYKSLGKLICEEKYIKDLDGPAEELSVAFFSVLLCGILGFSIFFFIKKRMSFKQMFLGPHKIIILPSDLDFNNLSITNFKSKIIEEGSKPENIANESKEIDANGSGHLLKATTNAISPNQSTLINTAIKIDKQNVNTSASSKLNNSIPVLGPHQGFQLARYMGDIVIIRPTPIKGSHIKSKTMRVLRMIRDLRHENINNLIGIYLKPEPPHSLVWEYCSRGSVEDIIKAENIKLDWQFKVSLLTDLAKGMRYIHSSPIRCHGNLKSRNCVIDSRWVLKVTGYGMTYLSEVEDFRIEKSLEDLLWVAPELLRDPILMAKGTQSGDIYSFAIIVQELIVRGPPFNNSNITTEEILRKIQKPPPLIRPNVSKQDAPPQAIQLMKQCWAEPPNMRPDFNQILEQLKTTIQGRKTNIVDTMFKLLEKYSSNLEEIVQERTMQLEEERKKTEALLEKMLPKSVADSLKMGKRVDPESYGEVTIYFSDIVGFTTISAESTPFEVVDFLNDLYTCFDSVIQNYDAYKVETIGDAYMVVSGLPERNEERHAIEIATLSLDLLHSAGTFIIRHKPDIRLKLRIGLHTGPCAAGVVGLTMPRYCLFGDTVNTASRMESNGKPLKIHISWTLRDKLEALGGFDIKYRGDIQIKGKGLMKTYWLLGKNGFDKSLPTLSDDDDK